MKRIALGVVLIVACENHSHVIEGARFQAEIPAGWHAAGADSLIDDAGSNEIRIVELVDDKPTPAPLPAPQANLMGTVAVGVTHGEVTAASCQAGAARMGIAGAASVATFGEARGCEIVGDAVRTFARPVADTVVFVSCPRIATVDAACDQVVRSLHERPAR